MWMYLITTIILFSSVIYGHDFSEFKYGSIPFGKSIDEILILKKYDFNESDPLIGVITEYQGMRGYFPDCIFTSYGISCFSPSFARRLRLKSIEPNPNSSIELFFTKKASENEKYYLFCVMKTIYMGDSKYEQAFDNLFSIIDNQINITPKLFSSQFTKPETGEVFPAKIAVWETEKTTIFLIVSSSYFSKARSPIILYLDNKGISDYQKYCEKEQKKKNEITKDKVKNVF